MDMYDIINIDEIDDSHEFSCGERFRLHGIGMNNVPPEDDYYEYMLVDNHDEFMIAANVSDKAGYIKAGYVIAHVAKVKDVSRHVVSAQAVKFSLGTENVSWLRRK